MNQAVGYLENFWEPSAGDSIKFGDRILTIKEIDTFYPSQALVSEADEIVHLQDVQWNLSVNDGLKIVDKMGIGIDEKGKSLFGFRSFFKYPETLDEVVEAIKYFRHLSILNGKDLI